jgi:hypothetical protein
MLNLQGMHSNVRRIASVSEDIVPSDPLFAVAAAGTSYSTELIAARLQLTHSFVADVDQDLAEVGVAQAAEPEPEAADQAGRVAVAAVAAERFVLVESTVRVWEARAFELVSVDRLVPECRLEILVAVSVELVVAQAVAAAVVAAEVVFEAVVDLDQVAPLEEAVPSGSVLPHPFELVVTAAVVHWP